MTVFGFGCRPWLALGGQAISVLLGINGQFHLVGLHHSRSFSARLEFWSQGFDWIFVNFWVWL